MSKRIKRRESESTIERLRESDKHWRVGQKKWMKIKSDLTKERDDAFTMLAHLRIKLEEAQAHAERWKQDAISANFGVFTLKPKDKPKATRQRKKA